jgi:hypothetical protein
VTSRLSGEAPTLGEEAAAFLRGERRALQFLIVLKGISGDGDELHRLIRSTPPDELRGLCRAFQKRLEQLPRSAR